MTEDNYIIKERLDFEKIYKDMESGKTHIFDLKREHQDKFLDWIIDQMKKDEDGNLKFRDPFSLLLYIFYKLEPIGESEKDHERSYCSHVTMRNLMIYLGSLDSSFRSMECKDIKGYGRGSLKKYADIGRKEWLPFYIVTSIIHDKILGDDEGTPP